MVNKVVIKAGMNRLGYWHLRPPSTGNNLVAADTTIMTWTTLLLLSTMIGTIGIAACP